MADPSTPLEEQIEGFNQQIKRGLCLTVSSIAILSYLWVT